mmetsp:Transcript_33420/g.84698  ORF Transcript_33420/g.84698 Transcript_33420/m.84698 type:complete len:224 (-) Transcript_33420:4-675(-)
MPPSQLPTARPPACITSGSCCASACRLGRCCGSACVQAASSVRTGAGRVAGDAWNGPVSRRSMVFPRAPTSCLTASSLTGVTASIAPCASILLYPRKTGWPVASSLTWRSVQSSSPMATPPPCSCARLRARPMARCRARGTRRPPSPEVLIRRCCPHGLSTTASLSPSSAANPSSQGGLACSQNLSSSCWYFWPSATHSSLSAYSLLASRSKAVTAQPLYVLS